MNFAHLTSFQAIEFMGWPVPKTLDISVCQTNESKAFKTQHSVTVVRPLFTAKNENTILISSPVSTFSARSIQHYDHHNNVERFGESTGKLGLKMTNKTHTGERKRVQLSYLVPAQLCNLSSLNLFLSIRVRQYGQVSKHQRSCTILWLLRCGGATTHIFLGAQPKIQSHMRPVGH